MQNRPNPAELLNLLTILNVRNKNIGLTLGKTAFDAYCKVCDFRGLKFGHNKIYSILNNKTLIVTYHPSRRNTNTGTLTWQMWIDIFKAAKKLIKNYK
jgi:uracil-DNA glycosylase